MTARYKHKDSKGRWCWAIAKKNWRHGWMCRFGNCSSGWDFGGCWGCRKCRKHCKCHVVSIKTMVA